MTNLFYDAVSDKITKFRYVVCVGDDNKIVGRSHTDKNADRVAYRKGGRVVDLLWQNTITKHDYRDRLFDAADTGDLETISMIENSKYYMKLKEIENKSMKEYLRTIE